MTANKLERLQAYLKLQNIEVEQEDNDYIYTAPIELITMLHASILVQQGYRVAIQLPDRLRIDKEGVNEINHTNKNTEQVSYPNTSDR